MSGDWFDPFSAEDPAAREREARRREREARRRERLGQRVADTAAQPAVNEPRPDPPSEARTLAPEPNPASNPGPAVDSGA